MLPMTSLGGCSYYMTFIDDFSRKTWIFFLKKKDEAFMWFRTLKSLGAKSNKEEDQDIEDR